MGKRWPVEVINFDVYPGPDGDVGSEIRMFYDMFSFTRGRRCSSLITATFYTTYIQSPEGDNATALAEFAL